MTTERFANSLILDAESNTPRIPESNEVFGYFAKDYNPKGMMKLPSMKVLKVSLKE